MTILNFIFSDMWNFVGTVILLSITLNGLAAVIGAMRR